MKKGMYVKMKKINFWDIKINDGFWKEKQEMVKKNTVDAVYNRFYETHRFDALSCSWKEGEENMPHIFWDSDVAKWIEGVSYILMSQENKKWEKIIDEAVDEIVKNSDENGYFNSHFSTVRPNEKFRHRNDHELYCAGHLIEAAIAYNRATGKDKFLKAMCRYADYIEKVFKTEKSAGFTTPGHPELELALVKLYEATGENRYMELAKFFIDEHSKHENDRNCFPRFNEYYNQDEVPIRERKTAEGHCVRAMYLMSGVTDVARYTNDQELQKAAERVFDNVIQKRMYITGAIGSTHIGEAFTVDYDLPNRSAYTETCASISLAMFAGRMLMSDVNSKYANIVERAIYNGFLSGVSMDGKAFFYENPLEIDPEFNNINTSTEDKERFPITQRKEVFSCSCCPPNVVRFIPSIADYMYTYDDKTLYIHQFIASEAEDNGMKIKQETLYPTEGKLRISCDARGRKIAIRIPDWCRKFSINKKYEMKNGYAYIENTDSIEVEFDMTPNQIRANRRVHADAGRVAVMRGPVVYCAEGVDNGSDLINIRIAKDAKIETAKSDFLLPSLTVCAEQLPESDNLYSFADDEYKPIELKLIPYYAFANRGESEMLVWLLSK